MNQSNHFLVWCLLLNLLWLPQAYANTKIVLQALLKDTAVININGKQKILKIGKPSDGLKLISVTSEVAIIEHDGEQHTYSINSTYYQAPANKETKTASKKLTIIPDEQGMYTVTGTINGSNVRFVVDTGATLISMNGNLAKRLGIDYKLIGQKSQSYTASGIADIYIVTLKKVNVGGIVKHNVTAAVHHGDFPNIALLGMSFLKDLSINRDVGVMEIEKKY